jgi:hypothetical protein
MLVAVQPCLPGGLDALETPVTPDVPPPARVERAAAPRAAPPSPLGEETARYRLSFGLFGEVGEISLSLAPPTAAAPTRARLAGHGRGSILGLGDTERSIETEFDPAEGGTHRWTTRRVLGDKVVTDVSHQHVSGSVTLVRQRAGRPDSHLALTRPGAVLDPLGFLMRLRLEPPRARRSYEVLDGRGLWRMALEPTRAVAGRPAVLRIDGVAHPIDWDGAPDGERDARRFSLELADDAHRTPLRFVMPLGLGDVRAELVSVTRPEPAGPFLGAPSLSRARQVVRSLGLLGVRRD